MSLSQIFSSDLAFVVDGFLFFLLKCRFFSENLVLCFMEMSRLCSHLMVTISESENNHYF